MKSSASWRNAGRLRVAEPALARLPLVQTPDQRRVLAQVAKLLVFVQGEDRSYIGVRAASDSGLTSIERSDHGYLVTEHNRRNVRLASTADVLRFLSTRPIVELRLLTIRVFYQLSNFDIAFQGNGLETVVWDTYQPPSWVAGGWQQRLWRLLTYIQLLGGRVNSVSLVLEPDDLGFRNYPYVHWNGREFQTLDEEDCDAFTDDIRQVVTWIAQSKPVTKMGLESDTSTIWFLPPDYRNPWG